jgi:predicted Zn finger-like uncharacterized protein
MVSVPLTDDAVGSRSERPSSIDSPMLIHCPTCGTSYNVKTTALGAAGRSVRCVRCRTVWFAGTQVPDPYTVSVGGAHFETPPPSQTAPRQVERGMASESGELAAEELEAASDDPNLGIAVQQDAEETQAGTAGQEPFLDPGARALAMETEGPSPFDAYTPITMADAPPIAPIDHDGSTIPSEAPKFTEIPDRIDRFIARRSAKSESILSSLRRLPTFPILAASLAAVLLLLVLFRSTAVAAMPQLASLYERIGLPVNLRGLTFENLKTIQENSDSGVVLLVEGTIVNVAKSSLEVPRLRLAVRNGSGDEVYEWTALASRSILGRGERLPFKTRLASPPSDGREVVVRFFNRRDAAGGMH